MDRHACHQLLFHSRSRLIFFHLHTLQFDEIVCLHIGNRLRISISSSLLPSMSPRQHTTRDESPRMVAEAWVARPWAMVVPYARPLIEEIADLTPQILTEMLERTVERQTVKCPVLCTKRWLQEIVSQERKPCKSDAETNDAFSLQRTVTTSKARRFIQDTDAPLHDECDCSARQAHGRKR